MNRAKEEKISKKKTLSNKEIKKKVLQEQGITLIALVITIIILLILAGVTLNAAIGENGLFQRSKLATEKYEEAEANETASLAQFEKEIKNAYIDYNDYVGYEVTGYDDLIKEKGNCEITSEASGVDADDIGESEGQVKQTSNMDESGKQTFEKEDLGGWQIWDYNTSTKVIRLISAKPTEATLTLKGENGYNNGVWALNKICRQCYGTSETGVSVANLKRSDIQKVTTYDYTTFSHANNDGAKARSISLWKCENI